MLEKLPDTPERARKEITLQITLGPALIATKGQGDLEDGYENDGIIMGFSHTNRVSHNRNLIRIRRHSRRQEQAYARANVFQLSDPRENWFRWHVLPTPGQEKTFFLGIIAVWPFLGPL